MRTFYLAASSAAGNLERVKQCMADLEALGLTNIYDWTKNLQDPVENYGKLAVIDLDVARRALILVLLGDPMSPGGMAEFGARIASGGIADVVGGEHLFFHHPQVVRHVTWPAFLAHLKRPKVSDGQIHMIRPPLAIPICGFGSPYSPGDRFDGAYNAANVTCGACLKAVEAFDADQAARRARRLCVHGLPPVECGSC